MNQISAILFDLGGVLVELDGKPIQPDWLDHNRSYEQSWNSWLSSPSVQAFDRGEISPTDFSNNIIRELGLNVSPCEFIDWITDWPKELFPGVFKLLDDLSEKYELGVFSNIASLHWPKYKDALVNHGALTHYFASYLIGLAKPDPAAFDYIADAIQKPRSEIFFVDDNQINVNAAIDRGIQAECAKGIEQVRIVLKNRGIL